MPEAHLLSVPGEARDRLVRVRVRGLFGIFDHTIPLDLESRMTVIHGPNGVGKTVVLKMIHEVLSGAPEVLARVPYDEFQLDFMSGDTITVRQVPQKSKDTRSLSLECIAILDGQRQHFLLEDESNPNILRQVAPHLNTWQYKGLGKWEDIRDGEVISSEELVR